MSKDVSDKTPKLPGYIVFSVEQDETQRRHLHEIGTAVEFDGGFLVDLGGQLPDNGKIALHPRDILDEWREEEARTQQLQQVSIKP